MTITKSVKLPLTTPERYAKLTRGMLKGTWGRTREEIEQYLKGERETWPHHMSPPRRQLASEPCMGCAPPTPSCSVPLCRRGLEVS
jgi:hypothetical protein